MGLTDSLVTFVVGLVGVTLGIHIGAIVILGQSTIGPAAFTAAGDAVVWFLASHFFGWVHLLCIVLTFIVSLAFVIRQYL